MRVLLDANVFLSFLLAPTDYRRTVTRVVAACLTDDAIDLLTPPELIVEITTRASTKRYLRTRISASVIEALLAQLEAVAELLPPVESDAYVSRDPNDNYLATYGILYEADYLVTGDLDLLSLGRVSTLRIVTPATFLSVLDARMP